jgi:riboflavin biosynthesis pyrimidine reductase
MTSPFHSVEICMISTPDGVIDVNGRSRPLGGPADQARLIALRGAASPSKPGLRIAVVTKTCALDFSSPLFSSGAGLVATTVNAPALSVDSVRAGETDVDMAGIIAQLPHGVVHVEGGPMLNAALFDADCVDAINLTMSPRLGGFRAPSLSQAPHAIRHFTCVSLTTDSDFVFARYEKVTTA